MVNKKIIGTKPTFSEGISFKSKLEQSCYRKLKEAGFNVEYEPQRYIINEGLRLTTVKCFQPSKTNRRELVEFTRPLLPITYTPDFLIRFTGLYCFFDAKGYANDRYPLKKKMFLELLERMNKETSITYLFFEVHSVAQVIHSIQIMKEYEATGKN